MSPAGFHPEQILQHPYGKPAMVYCGRGQWRRWDDLDLLCYVLGTSGRLVPFSQRDRADPERFNGWFV